MSDAQANKPIELVRAAKARMESAYLRAADWQKPKVHAKIAILNADLIDRTIGLTFGAEVTPGLKIAEAISAVKS